MAELRSFVTFEANFPDDAEWSEAGDIAVPEGRALADHLVSQLRIRRLDVAAPVQHSFYGWAFDLGYESYHFRFVLQHVEPWLLLGQIRLEPLSIISRRKSEVAFLSLLVELNAAIQSSDRISSPAWYTKSEFESKPRPIGSGVPG